MIKYKRNNHPKWKWELEEDYKIKITIRARADLQGYILLNRYGDLYLFKGYTINGVNLLPDRKVWMRGAFVHDALWQLITLGKLPKSMVGVSNRIFRDIIAEDDNKFNAWLMYVGVQLGGLWRFKLKPVLSNIL